MAQPGDEERDSSNSGSDVFHDVPDDPMDPVYLDFAAARRQFAEDDEDEDDDDPDYRPHRVDDDIEEEDEFEDEDVDENDDNEDDEELQEENDEPPGDFALNVLGLLRENRVEGADAGIITRAQLLALLRNADFDGLDDDDDDDDPGPLWGLWGGRRRRARPYPKDPNRFPKVPSEEGEKLMQSGRFGAHNDDRRGRKGIFLRALDKELGLGGAFSRKKAHDLMVQDMIPSTRADTIIHYEDPVYSGQFSDDGNFFFSCCQDFKVRMYDTSNPYNWKHYKTAIYPWGAWTLTDASLSPDNKWLAYTSISTLVSIAPTDPNDTGDPYTLDLDARDDANAPMRWGRHRPNFGIFSIRFSGDGRELVAGTNSHAIVVYDIESRRVLHHIDGHLDDVNAVCFADKLSPNILYSGSDDTTIKVWDRRSMGDRREAGAFLGHVEGLTYIDSKGDGRYILSNGKDQSMKLWDIRMAMSTDRLREISGTHHTHGSGFDYRGNHYDEDDWDPHPHDNSLVTFRGHKVLRTLIRCHFSPPNSTDSRYVFTGSSDGNVHVYNMDATIAKVIDVRSATKGTRRIDRTNRPWLDSHSSWGTCVRDVSWHPTAPVIVASAMNGNHLSHGTCSIHSYTGAGEDGGVRPGRSVSEVIERDENRFVDSDFDFRDTFSEDYSED
ncbi:hypothetical protein S7711_05880 [Stachybotrys chartarum IBT 7711]|uniref:Uncharacterized protein n=1 Tax=Stachybotrys chartarum (strain CBS 109288 / IBT 7711) TaxID=1280523 RepID=A0A084AKP9_STACB|nr:hypothetical protein S7711_05880 [Stachybotrys chartarum IBT 7711]